MFGEVFRPWGFADWLLPKLPVHDWLVVGSVSTEDRCMAVLHHLSIDSGLQEARFLEIKDEQSEYSDECDRKRLENRNELDGLLGSQGVVTEFGLLDAYIVIKQFVSKIISDGHRHIVVDISTLPKRFFFPIIRLLLKEEQVVNLVATYSIPLRYSSEELAFDPHEWSILAPFHREVAPPVPDCSHVIVGVGFLPFGLPELIKQDYQAAKVTLLFPFPPGPPQFQRNWRFVHELKKSGMLEDDRQIIRVEAHDVSGCFDHIAAVANDDFERTIFAPFGPKSHSLAMCLLASKFDCDVYYSQPSYYHPDYSQGMKMHNGKPETYAYAIKLNGANLY